MSRASAHGTETRRTADWRDHAACLTTNPSIFYSGDEASTEEARRICTSCPVRSQCLTAAYTERDQWAIRGGRTVDERKRALRDAGGIIARAVADALQDTVHLLTHIYQQHTVTDDGHLIWTDPRVYVTVRGTAYTVNRIGFVGAHGRMPVGHVTRVCDRGGCVAADCLEDSPLREASRRRRVYEQWHGLVDAG
ncbi:WhiB family transcriptional regulator [Streptomyces typhae]|nr:WhiB family transcriptional regulator [Streptomyces typhae]